MKEQNEKQAIEEMARDMATCKDCNHFNACSKWTDFPNQCGVPVCARFEEKSEWISVDERLPEESACYLVNIINHLGVDFVTFTHYTKDYGWGVPDVANWMPLPEPPKGE